MALTQQHGFRSFHPPHQRLSIGGGAAVGSLGQYRQRHVPLEDGPVVKLLVADWTLGSNVNLALAVPVTGDAHLTEGVSTGDCHRDPKTIEADDTGQAGILRLHLCTQKQTGQMGGGP